MVYLVLNSKYRNEQENLKLISAIEKQKMEWKIITINYVDYISFGIDCIFMTMNGWKVIEAVFDWLGDVENIPSGERNGDTWQAYHEYVLFKKKLGDGFLIGAYEDVTRVWTIIPLTDVTNKEFWINPRSKLPREWFTEIDPFFNYLTI